MPAHKTMRITGGTLVRRRFLTPPMVDEGSVRPTPDRVREAVFSMLVHDIEGAAVLDLFAGSGAHGFEAISRGAKSVLFVEKDPRVVAVIKENMASLDVGSQCVVENTCAEKFVAKSPEKNFDVIFIDPPYTLQLDADFFTKVVAHLSPHGVIIFRCFKKLAPSFDERLVVDRDRVYAGTRVFVLRRSIDISEEAAHKT